MHGLSAKNSLWKSQIRYNAFQTKMWQSNLGKFRRVLVFGAERVCVSERFWLILRKKNKVVSWVQQGQYIQFNQNVQFNEKNRRSGDPFLRDSAFLISRSYCNLSEQNGYLFIILKVFRISNPPSQNTEQRQLSIIQEFRISDPQSI